jgi:hypothetical protein
MALLLRVLSATFGSAARAAGLFVALFAAYLLWSQAWPAYRAATHLAAQRPQLLPLVEELKSDLGKRQMTISELTVRLSRLSQQQYRLLEQEVSELGLDLEEASEQLERLGDELETALAEREKYCHTWNPFKLWMCREVEARTQRTREVVEPLFHQAKVTEEGLRRRLDEGKRALTQFDATDVLQRAHGSEAVMLRAALAEQTSAVARVEQSLAQAQHQLQLATQAELSPWAWLARELAAIGPTLVLIVLFVFVSPWLQRVCAYFVLMPFVERAKPIQLQRDEGGPIRAHEAKRSLTLTLEPGEKCWARADYVRPVEGRTRSQWLLDWRAPLVSYASGLSILTRIEVPAGTSRAVSTTLASPRDADSYLAAVTLQGQGLVFHPKHLVAVVGDVQLWTAWHVWSLHAWATGQLRYIGVRGTGRCVLEGFGDLVTATVDGSRQRIEQELVVAFDARLAYATARTETFLPYLLARTPLVDDVFSGRGVYLWQKNTRRQQRSFTERTFDVLFGALGKLLGF